MDYNTDEMYDSWENSMLELDSNTLCMACGCGVELLINEMYCFDCHKRQQFLSIFNHSASYSFGSYFGKHILEKYLGYYVSEDDFIKFMKRHDIKFNENKRLFRVKLNKKKALSLGISV